MPLLARLPDLRGLVIPVALLLLWEELARAGLLSPMGFSRPSEIFVAGLQMLVDGSLLRATIQTLQAVLAGFAIALVAGVALGLLTGVSLTMRQTLGPTLAALRSVPPIALLPLALLIFGFGVGMEAAVVAFACVWPILVAAVGAILSLDPKLRDVAAALEMSGGQYVRYIVLPSAVGRIVVGARIAMGIALIVGITVEIVLNPRGLGYGIITAQQSLRTDAMYAQLLWIGCVGWTVNALMVLVEHRVLGRYTRIAGR